MLILYGISNCDTVRKARRWLESQDIEYRYHDFRRDGLTREMLADWLTQVDSKELINTRGSTWRKLSDAKKAVGNDTAAIALMLEYPTIIKRPLLNLNGHYHTGFKDSEYASLFC